jgi:hypothetical protein
MDLVSPLLRNDFREFCVTYFVLRQINDIFDMAGLKQGRLATSKVISGQRRTLVEEYYASINWNSEQDTNKFLKVLEYAFSQSYLTNEARKTLQESFHREGLVVDGFHLYRKSETSPQKPIQIVSLSTLSALKTELLGLEKLEPHQRGFTFEKFLVHLFEAFGLSPQGSFRLTGEQIDGSLQFDADTYLLEAKWNKELTSQNDLLVFREKVESKSTWARGLFVSNSGFSPEALKAFARGRPTNIIGLTGQDIYFVLEGEISLTEALLKKARKAAETGEFYVSVFELTRG